jgi:hypothetical protein
MTRKPKNRSAAATPSEDLPPSEYYKQAIGALANYVAAEPDEQKALVGMQKMMFYEHAIIDASFNSIHRRTMILGNLRTDLTTIINEASNVTTVANSIKSLKNILGEVTGVMAAI